ncbi:MAG: DUF2190 family protein [Comamonas sp.]|uniref:DUF2190 family protein n=1 Tax=Comamonas sp. TaxID=34028 RepID=UPI002FC77ADA
MAKNHVQPGKVLDYVNDTGADIASGDVVKAGALLGVALKDIPDGETGSVAVDGVFAVPKVAGTAIAQGAAVVFKAATKAFTVGATAAGDVSGAAAVAFNAAAAGDTVVNIKFTGCPGTVAA